MPPEFLFALPLFAVEENAGALQSVATLNQKAEREEAPSGDPREEATSSPAQSEPREDEYSAQVRLRRELGQVHRALGITAWASMTLTTALGFIQYYNLYGFGAGQDENPCAVGNAIFGQDQCYGDPWPHRVGWIVTAIAYSGAGVLSYLFPDPNRVKEGHGPYAQKLRIHEALRWVHLIGMGIQIALGLGHGLGIFGDRANHYEELRAVATTHLITGMITYGALTAAGAIMLF